MLCKPLQVFALEPKVRCLHKLDLCDRTACQDIKGLVHFGQKAAAFCLLLCWKSNNGQDSWPVLPASLTFPGYCFIWVSLATQLWTWSLADSAFLSHATAY